MEIQTKPKDSILAAKIAIFFVAITNIVAAFWGFPLSPLAGVIFLTFGLMMVFKKKEQLVINVASVLFFLNLLWGLYEFISGALTVIQFGWRFLVFSAIAQASTLPILNSISSWFFNLFGGDKIQQKTK